MANFTRNDISALQNKTKTWVLSWAEIKSARSLLDDWKKGHSGFDYESTSCKVENIKDVYAFSVRLK